MVNKLENLSLILKGLTTQKNFILEKTRKKLIFLRMLNVSNCNFLKPDIFPNFWKFLKRLIF